MKFWFLFKYVESGSGDPPALESSDEVVVDHQSAASGVYRDGQWAEGLWLWSSRNGEPEGSSGRAGSRTDLRSLLKLDPKARQMETYFFDHQGEALASGEATLPTYVKMLGFVILLPRGNRELGLQQLQIAADKRDMVKLTCERVKQHFSAEIPRLL
ncbi:MAG TPA: hypothetical protein VMT20_20355 [Terriglobia bacterium]|nr:hypothetical protein [Terriglobia bacterium]